MSDLGESLRKMVRRLQIEANNTAAAATLLARVVEVLELFGEKESYEALEDIKAAVKESQRRSN